MGGLFSDLPISVSHDPNDREHGFVGRLPQLPDELREEPRSFANDLL